jgi:hypothetical protein
MSVTVRAANLPPVAIVAVTAAQPVRVTPSQPGAPSVRLLISDPPGRQGESGLAAETTLDLAGWYQLAKEL